MSEKAQSNIRLMVAVAFIIIYLLAIPGCRTTHFFKTETLNHSGSTNR